MSINESIKNAASAIAETAIGQAVRNYGSEQLSNVEDLATGEQGPAGFAKQSFKNWLDLIGDITGGKGDDYQPIPPQEFEPGQCETRYIIKYKYTTYSLAGDETGQYEGFIERAPISGRPYLYGPISEPFVTPTNDGRGELLKYTYHLEDSSQRTGPIGGTPSGTAAINLWQPIRIDKQPDECGKGSSPPPYEPQPGIDGEPGGFVPDGYGYAGGQPAVCFLNGGVRFCFGPGGSSIDFDADGIPEIDTAPPPTGGGDANCGFTDSNGDGKPDIEDRINGNPDAPNDGWPVTVPTLLTEEDSNSTDLNSLPQAIAWFARNLDATAGAWPLQIKIEDTDPLTEGNQSETVSFPNQSELLAELFGLNYESSLNTAILTQAIFKLIPEVLAIKSSSLRNQDFITTITEYLGMRTQDKEIEVPNNFNPEDTRSIRAVLQPSNVYVRGIKNDDPHTLVSWLQQINYWAQIAAIPHFRGKDQLENLAAEINSFTKEPGERSAEDWEKFIDHVNSQFSPLNRDKNHGRPKAYSVDDLRNDATQIPTT